ncbi:mannan endo-1,6-alpha-mannosidase [Sarocladium strictum]
MVSLWQTLSLALGLLPTAQSIEVQWDSKDSIKEAAATAAYGLVKFYTGNNTGDVPGNLPAPHFWWEAGAMFGTLIDYWDMTGDESYNKITMQAMVHQAGPDRDYMPQNQTLQMGNDDQGFWVMSAMSAAEKGFPDPPEDEPQWVALAQAAFNEWVGRWEDEHCGGGLRWQVFRFNTGFDYKNTISNGCFFNTASRLARYTGNKTYADWADKIFQWQLDTGLITDDWNVYDGRHALEGGGCGKPDTKQWTYNAGIYLSGASSMWNHTEDQVWKERTEGILKRSTEKFFRNGTLHEQYCERGINATGHDVQFCNQDQRTFKGYLLRWLAHTAQMAPYTYDDIMPLLRSAGESAAAACVGPIIENFQGHDGTACGFTWLEHNNGPFDGKVGVGEQMNALDAFMYNLVEDARPAVTNKTGGTSKGNAGGGRSDKDKLPRDRPITMADKVGAGFVTAILLGIMIAFVSYILWNDKEPPILLREPRGKGTAVNA